MWVNPPRRFFRTFFPKWLEIFSSNFTCLLHVPIYAGLQIFIQLSATLTRLRHIKRDHIVLKMHVYHRLKRMASHAEWSHLIWHSFVTVGDNWIKICILAYIWRFNRRVKLGLKIPNSLGKMSENASVCFGRWWTFRAHDVNWVATLNMA